MTTMKYAALVLAVAGVLTAGGLAGAQGPGGGGMGPGFEMHRPPMERSFGQMGARGQWWNNPDVVKQLSLTDEQRKAMDGIMQDHRLKLIDLQANLERAEVSLGPLLKADTPDRAAIEAQINKVVTARADLERANSLFLLDLRMQLNPDQWKKLVTMHQERMMPGRGRGPWGHDGRQGMRGPGGQFHRPPMPPPPGGAAPQQPAQPQGSQPSGTGDVQ